ncbi:uncharacterized protein LOC130778481 [Actinidia eriantha]|uniref:uncharacterized protein LOC130778481 n=1 Tax=Actinidia eriantha TaxID=165200 RepID=UPI00258DA1BD|nr:uncharacterized protein LOC130778481 [Actinidia eriantha]
MSSPFCLPNQPLSLSASLSSELSSLSLLFGSPISVLNTASKRSPSYGSSAPSRSSRTPRLLNHIYLVKSSKTLNQMHCLHSGNLSSLKLISPRYSRVAEQASLGSILGGKGQVSTSTRKGVHQASQHQYKEVAPQEGTAMEG